MAHKYRAVPTVVDGIRFASKAEARRYGELKMLEKAGKIEDLELQPIFPIEVNDVRVGLYRGDFAYYPTHKDGAFKGAIIGHRVVEDVKGMKTPMYRLKKKLVEAIYGIQITEVA